MNYGLLGYNTVWRYMWSEIRDIRAGNTLQYVIGLKYAITLLVQFSRVYSKERNDNLPSPETLITNYKSTQFKYRLINVTI